MPILTNEEFEKNFADINPQMTKAEARAEANRCLFCYDAPCTNACPTHIDVPAFIKKIATENLKGAAKTIFDANPIGGSCARVCPVEVLCEGACVEKTLVEKPIEIGRLQRFATDFLIEKDEIPFSKGEANGRSVAIIGSGPAGLSAATYLARLGYAVTIYERKSLAGGLDTYGMAEYKMTQAESLDEVQMVERLGVKFVLETEILAEDDAEKTNAIGISELRNLNDAVVLCAGLGKTRNLQINGESLSGVYESLEFIEKIKTRNWQQINVPETVCVIGAGNTAIDCVTQAKRLGAKTVKLVYRKTEKEMSAYDYEYELAKQDGVEFVWQTTPIEVIGESSVEALKCRRTDGSEEDFEFQCQMVIKAIGQQKRFNFFETIGVELDENGRVLVNENMETSIAGVFAAGDCVNGGGEAVEAAQAGKRAASGIHRLMFGKSAKIQGLSS
ncbi:MAG: NAD(P)-dependent oxidoreductase [Pyrinomonadaceae bacterium]